MRFQTFKTNYTRAISFLSTCHKLWQHTALCILIIALSQQAQAQCKLDRSNYRIVFQDEFNYKNAEELLASGRWEIDGFDGPGTEYYTTSQVEFPGGGIIRLKANLLPLGPQRQQLDTTALHSETGRKLRVAYASSRLRSTMAYDSTYGPATWRKKDWMKGFAYGMFEIRCKLPAAGKGTWPAFWLLSPGSEIDIIDNNSEQPQRYLSSGVLDWDKRNAYCAAYGNAACDSLPLKAWTCGGRGFKEGRDLSQDFNTYAVVWTPTQVSFFLNDREQYTVTNEQVKIHAYTSRIIASLQMREDAESLGITHAEMDIDYINVYKPINGKYAVSYDKSAQEYQNYKLQNPLNIWPEYVSPAHKSIAVNPNNKDEIFFRGTNDMLYRSLNSGSTNWVSSEIDPKQAEHPNWLIDGDVVFNSKYGLVIYRGRDGRLQAYSFHDTWHHQYLDSNGPTTWQPSPTPGSITAATTGDIYYVGRDHRMQLVRLSDSAKWAHTYIDYTREGGTLPESKGGLVQGDIVLEETGRQVNIYYKGLDNKIQTLRSSDSSYTHAYLNLDGLPASTIIDSTPGSIAHVEKGNVFFMGADKLIHWYQRIEETGQWQHALLSSGDNNNYPAFQGNIAWDNVKSQLIYFGTDGRLQSFYRNQSGAWTHRWIDDYYNTPLHKGIDPLVATTQFTSLTVGPTGDIFYRGRSNEFRCFTYTGCRYINPSCENWNMSLSMQLFPEVSKNRIEGWPFLH